MCFDKCGTFVQFIVFCLGERKKKKEKRETDYESNKWVYFLSYAKVDADIINTHSGFVHNATDIQVPPSFEKLNVNIFSPHQVHILGELMQRQILQHVLACDLSLSVSQQCLQLSPLDAFQLWKKSHRKSFLHTHIKSVSIWCSPSLCSGRPPPPSPLCTSSHCARWACAQTAPRSRTRSRPCTSCS